MERVRIEHDGFIGDLIGLYVTREGQRGAVLQEVGTGVLRCEPCPVTAAEPASEVRNYIDQLVEQSTEVFKDPKSFRTRLPERIWQYREVIRHHTFRALLRRIPKHVRRIFVEHHFRDYTYRDLP